MSTKTEEPPAKVGRRLISAEELRERFGINYSRVHIYRMVRDGRFPRPVKLGPSRGARKAWFEDDVNAWFDQLQAQQGEVSHG